jgi:hypothetical protein
MADATTESPAKEGNENATNIDAVVLDTVSDPQDLSAASVSSAVSTPPPVEIKIPPPSPDNYPLSYHENDGLGKYGGRDLLGYGPGGPSPKWPRKAKVALSFVINYEEGGESCLLHGDSVSEKLLSDIVGAPAYGMHYQFLFFSLFVSDCLCTGALCSHPVDAFNRISQQKTSDISIWKAYMIMGLGSDSGDCTVFSPRRKSL